MRDTTTLHDANDSQQSHDDIVDVVLELLRREMPAAIDGLREDGAGGKIIINIDRSGTRANVEFPPRVKRLSAKK